MRIHSTNSLFISSLLIANYCTLFLKIVKSDKHFWESHGPLCHFRFFFSILNICIIWIRRIVLALDTMRKLNRNGFVEWFSKHTRRSVSEISTNPNSKYQTPINWRWHRKRLKYIFIENWMIFARWRDDFQ